MNLINLLKKFKRPDLFTTPSHSGVGFGEFAKLVGQKIFTYDFSEIDGFDNIRNPQDILKKSQENAAKIYDSQASFYLYNGSTSGILALMLSVLKENDKVLVPKNCHISVLNGLILSRADGIFWEPCYDEVWGVPKPINPELIKEKLEENIDIKAVIITNPTYEGVVSDIKKIAEICNQKNVVLLVDEAHGALWNFSERLPTTAIKLGADASVQSLHKTAGALTQSSILHIAKNSKISPQDVQKSLNLLNSTSPSYLLLASIEGAIGYLSSPKGSLHLDKTLDDIANVRHQVTKLKNDEILDTGDFTKIVPQVHGMTGFELSEELAKNNIEDELATDFGIMLLCGLGTTKNKLNKFFKVMEKISSKI